MTGNDSKRGKLGIITAMHMFDYRGGLYVHGAFGRVIDRLAGRYEKVYLCAPIRKGEPNQSRDYLIRGDNVEMVALPFHQRTIESLRHYPAISRAYARLFRKSDFIFLRGMIPFVIAAYLLAILRRKKPCHWIVGNPIAAVKSNPRAGCFMDLLSIGYAWQDRIFVKLGRRLTGGTFICNGQEVGQIYKSSHTMVTVSSTIADDEIFEREDTCNEDSVKILFVGFVRPEKGLEYLLEAVSKLRIDKPWELTIVGSWEPFKDYREKLDRIITYSKIEDRVHWAGYASYGSEMSGYLRQSDIFVFPTLSEGTPRVLVEARANGLPVVATNVGGIPTSVTDGKDGLLVPPKDVETLAMAIERVVKDGKLRRSLIRNGLGFAKRTTVNKFIELVVDNLE